MATSAKSLSLLKELADRLARRTSLAVSSVSFDGDGNGWIRVGTAGAGNQTMVIKSKPEDPAFELDGIGLPSRAFTPSVIQLVLETSTIASVPLMTAANLVPLLGEVLRQGTRVELYLSVNTNPTDVGDITGTPAAVWDADLQFRSMDSQ